MRAPRSRHVVALLVLTGGAILSARVHSIVSTSIEESARASFERLAADRIHGVETHILTSFEVVESVAALFEASERVDRSDFREFVGPALARHPEIQALEWVPRVAAADRERIVDAARGGGAPGFRLTELGHDASLVEATSRAEHYPVYFVEPLAGNERALGFDLGSHPARLGAILRAGDSGLPALSERLDIVQGEPGEPWVLYFVPVHARARPIETPEERRAALSGLALGVFHVGRLVEHASNGAVQGPIRIRIEDVTEGTPGEILDDRLRRTAAAATGEEGDAGRSHESSRVLDIAGRRWTVTCEAPMSATASHGWGPLSVLAIGILLSLLAAGLCLVFSDRAARVRELVQVRTRELDREMAEKGVARSRLAIQVAVARELALARNAEEGLSECLRALTESLGWTTGVLWTIDRAAGVLRSTEFYHRKGAELDLFERETRRKIFAPGEGLPGRVWASRRPEWIRVAEDANFPRAGTAARAGLATGVALPIVVGGDPVGVLEFLSTRAEEPDSSLIELLGSIGNQIGQFLERKRAEVEREEEEARFRAVFEHAPFAVLIVAEDGRVVLANPKAAETFGHDPRDLAGRPVEDLVPAAHREAHIASREGYYRNPRPRPMAERGSLMALRKDGTEIPVEIGLSSFATRRGRAFLAFIQDVSSLKTAKEAAEAASRAKTAFLTNVSHDLRTPLNSVIGFANILLKNPEGRLAGDDLLYLGRILENGKNLLSLINQVLDLAKIEAGKVEVERRPVVLSALAGAVAGELASQVREGVRLGVETPGDLAPIQTDEGKVRQILVNLVGNALKFTEKGSVTIRVLADPASGRPRALEVVDTGIGIPRDHWGPIFEAFRQVDQGTARRFGGTGLGLTISRSLCQLLGYGIEVESEVGSGSTFRVVLDPGNEPGRA